MGKGIMINPPICQQERVAFVFDRTKMTNVTDKQNDQRVIQDFTNYINDNLPQQCLTGVWFFVNDKYLIDYFQMYALTYFVVRNGEAQCMYRKSYSTATMFGENVTWFDPNDNATWMWGSYLENGVTYYGTQISD